MNFKEIFEKTADKVKLDFLFQKLSTDVNLRNEFLNKIPAVQAETASSLTDKNEFLKLVDTKAEEILEILNAIDISEVDWESYNYSYRDGYVEEWEVYQDLAEVEIEDATDYMPEILIQKLLQNDITGVFIELLSFHKAALQAEINDPNYCFDDVNDYLVHNKLSEFIEYTTKKIPVSSLDDVHINNAIRLFFSYFEREDKDNQSYISLFENLLIALIEIISDKKTVLKFSNYTKLERKVCPLFATHITKYNDESKDREKILTDLLLTKKEIGEELLEMYLENNKHNKYVETANRLFFFSLDKIFWAEKVANNINSKDDRKLFIETNFTLFKHYGNIKYYKKIKDILTQEEKEKLLNRISNPYLKVKIWEEEKKFETIKEYLKHLSYYDITIKILSTIKNVYPDFVLNKIEKQIEKMMNDPKRNRYTYQNVVEWLLFGNSIPDVNFKNKELIMRLYNHKPNLPALKDEFRKARLV